MIKGDLSDEIAREYDFNGRVYRIDAPKTLFTRKGGTTHRVLDSQGTVHLVPAPGLNGCVIRWFPKDTTNPVAF